MAKSKEVVKGGGLKKPPLPLHLQPPVVNADEVRNRIAKLTSAAAVPDPLTMRQFEVLSTGFLTLDYSLGVGGLLKGRLHVIEGESGSGKTALAIHIIAAWQRMDPRSVHAILDVEGTGMVDFFELLGANLDPSRFIFFRPESAEEACTIAMALMGYREEKNVWQRDTSLVAVSSIVYDSWAGSPVATAGMANLARVGSEWWPRLTACAGRVGTTIIAINQLREKPGVSFGDPRYSPGGKTFGFQQTTRLRVTKSNVVTDKTSKEKLSHDLRIDFGKTKAGPPPQPIHLTLNYKTGFDLVADAYAYFKIRGISFKEQKADAKEGNILSYSFTTTQGEVETIRENGETAFLQEIRASSEAQSAFLKTARDLAAQDLTGEIDG